MGLNAPLQAEQAHSRLVRDHPPLRDTTALRGLPARKRGMR